MLTELVDVREALYTARTDEERYDAVCKFFEYVSDLEWRLEKAEEKIRELSFQSEPIERMVRVKIIPG